MSVHFQGGATLWDATRRTVLRTWRLPGTRPGQVCFLGADKVFAEVDGKFSVTDARTGRDIPFNAGRFVLPRAACLDGGRVLLADASLDGAGRVVAGFHELDAALAPKVLASVPLAEDDRFMLGRMIAVSPGAHAWVAVPVYEPAQGRAEIFIHARGDWRRVDRVLSQARSEMPLTEAVAISQDGRHVLMAEAFADATGSYRHVVMHVDRETRRERTIDGLPAGRVVQVRALDDRYFLIGYAEESIVWDAGAARIERRWPGRSVPLSGAAPNEVADAGAGLRMADWRKADRGEGFVGSAARIDGALVRPATLTVGAGQRLRSFRFPELDSATFDVSGPLREGVALKSLSDDGRRSIWSVPEDEVSKRCGATPEEIAILPDSTDWIPFTTEHCFVVRDAAGTERLVRMRAGEALADVVFGEGGQILFAATEIASLKRATVAARAALAAVEKSAQASGRAMQLPDVFKLGDDAIALHARNHIYIQAEDGTVRRLATFQGDITALAYLGKRRQLAWLASGRISLMTLDGRMSALRLPAMGPTSGPAVGAKAGRIEHFQADATHAFVITRDPVPAESRDSVFAESLRPQRLTVLDLATGRAVASRSPWNGQGELGIVSASRQVLARDSEGRLFSWAWNLTTGHDRSMPRMEAFDEVRTRHPAWIIVDRLNGTSGKRELALWDVSRGDWWQPAAAARAACAEPLHISPAGDSVLCRQDARLALSKQQRHVVIDLASGKPRFTFSGESTARVGGLPRFLPSGALINVGERSKDIKVLQRIDAGNGAVRELLDSGSECGFCKFHVTQDAQGRLGVLRDWIAPRFRRQTEWVVFEGPDLKRVSGVEVPLRPSEVLPTDVGLLVLGFNARGASESAVHELGELDLAAGTWRSIAFREGDEWSPPSGLGGTIHLAAGTRTALVIGRPVKDRGEGGRTTRNPPGGERGLVAHRVDLDSGETSALPLDGGFDEPHSGLSLSPDGRHFAIRVARNLQHRVVLYALDPLARVGEAPLPDSATRLRWTAAGGLAAFTPGEGVTEFDPANLNVVRSLRDSIAQGVQYLLGPDGQIYSATQVEGRPELRRAGEAAALTYFADGLPAVEEVAGTLADGQYAITRHEDGGLAVWNVATRSWLARIFMSATGDWVIVDPQGRFDTSDIRGFNLARWSRADRPFESLSPEVFMREYFEPRLLTRLLGQESFRPVRPLDKLNLNQPRVTIRTAALDGTDQATVEVEVASADGKPVHDLRIFRDGQLVAWAPAEHGAVNTGDARQPAVFRFPAIALPARREVEFSAYAFNGDGVRSEYSRLKLERPVAAPAKPRAVVLSIGVNRTENPDFDLDFAGADARRLNAALVQRLTRMGRFANVTGTQLVSDDADRTGATKANIRKALTALARGQPGAPGPDDTVILSFSGHGLVDSQGNFRLMPHDTGPGRGKGVPPSNEDLARMIASDELALWLRDIDAGDFVFIVDACHSAATVESPDFKPGPMASRGLGQMAFDKGMRILAATQANDVALEAKATQQGLLSYALIAEGLEAFRADFKPADQRIMLDEWLAFAVNRVPDLTREVRTGVFRPVVSAAPDSGAIKTVRPRNAQPLPARIPLQRPSLFDFRERRGELVLQSREGAR